MNRHTFCTVSLFRFFSAGRMSRNSLCVIVFFAQGAVGFAKDQSIARQWDEVALSVIRLDRPHPPVQARNLFALSIAMYDAWACYDPIAEGYVYKKKHAAADVAAARREAVSYAAYRILKERYALAFDPRSALQALDRKMEELGYSSSNESFDLSTAVGIGNSVAKAIHGRFENDGALQNRAYVDMPASQGGYKPVNQPMVVGISGTNVSDINHWQPLAIANALDQNGLPTGPIQNFQGAQWMHVMAFALQRTDGKRPWFDPGPPPSFHGKRDSQFREELVELIHRSSELTPDDGVTRDFSPGAFGNNSIGTNDGTGHPLNPVTRKPYAPNIVKRGDFSRVVAEFWADGPKSETPPGHWNVIANVISDAQSFEKRIEGAGPRLDELEWDVKLYFALNGALHDAACAAWSIKCFYDGWRPITAIRYMGQMGQSTIRGLSSYHADGLPLIPGLVELVTPSSSKTGQRHERLPPGAIALRDWPGQPNDVVKQYSGVKWILAANWVPYQKKTFVTPAFPGYISGHSTFSRSAAEVLAAITGSPYFPGGIGVHSVPANTSLTFEKGPTENVQLQWATYYDAADQAGLSRLWGGIHVSADDLTGRRIGAQCGKQAWELAKEYFDGSVAQKVSSVRN